MNLSAAIANSLWAASNVPALRRLRRALNQPAATQLQLLHDYLEQNAQSGYGRAHGFGDIRTYDEFAHRVPLTDYDDLAPWVERIRKGEQNVLTSDAVTHLIPTSGSTGARKLVPFTARLQREFNRAIGPWISDIYGQHPSVMLGPAYWSISPVLKSKNSEPSAVPIGFEDDASYLGGPRKRLVESVMAVPSKLQLVADMQQFRYLTLLCLLRQRNLRLISIWHPSFLSLLLDALPDCWENLLADIHNGSCRFSDSLPESVLHALKLRPMPARATQLGNAGPTKLESIWPLLKIISCWGDGNAELAIADLQPLFPKTLIQRKGLIATEAFVTIPFSNSRPLAVRSHFFEFIDERGNIHLAHELQENEMYEIVVSTGGGLWRYRLQDEVQVTGFLGKTPSLRFLGRKGNVSDRFGEKLSEVFVTNVVQELLANISTPPCFTLLAPDENHSGCCYTLYIEGDVRQDFAALLDDLLMQNLHYAWCRKLGQLQPPRLFRINADGNETFIAHKISDGKRVGDIKPGVLSIQAGWSDRFDGNYCSLSEPMPLQVQSAKKNPADR